MEPLRRDAAPHELDEVAVADPRAEFTQIAGPGAEGADAQAGDLHAALVGMQPYQRLTEHLAHAVVPVGPHRLVRANRTIRRVEPDDVVAAGEDDAPPASLPRRLEQAMAADHVGVQDLVRRTPGLAGNAGEVGDALDIVHRLGRPSRRGEIALEHLVAALRCDRAQVVHAQPFRAAPQGRPQHRPDLPGGACQQQAPPARPFAVHPDRCASALDGDVRLLDDLAEGLGGGNHEPS
jgi:hypothetical protein